MSRITLLTILALVFASVHCQRRFSGRRNRGPNSALCRGKQMDIYFVLDSSSSIHIQDYQHVLDFVKEVVSSFDINPQYTRVGLLSFSNNIGRPIRLNQYRTKSDILSAVTIDNLPYRSGVTNTHDAIRHVRQDRDFRQDITKVMVVVTDGGSRSPGATAQEARLAREEGFYLFVVGIGQFLEESEWRSIASDPDSSFIFNITNFDLLDDVQTALPRVACPLPPITTGQSCRVAQRGNLIFAAAPGGAQSAMDLIEQFAQTTPDPNSLLQVSYVMDMCDGGEYVPLGSQNIYCRRNVSPRGTDESSLWSLLENVKRLSRGSGTGPRVVVLFLNDQMVRQFDNRRGRIQMYRGLESIKRIANVQLIPVNLGVAPEQVAAIRRVRIQDGDLINFSQLSISQQPEAKNDFNTAICQALNSEGVVRTTRRPIGPQ